MRTFDRLLVLAALATLALSLLPFAARFHWLLDLTSHFRLQYLVGALALLAALALRRRFAWTASVALAAAINLPPLLPYLPVAQPATASVATSVTVSVFTANLLYRKRTTPRRLLEIAREASPDVIVLVEYTPQWAHGVARLTADYPHRFELPQKDAYGIAVFSRLPLESAERMPLLDTGDAIEARVRTAAGAFTLIAVHLRAPTTAARAATRNRQLEMLAERRAAIDGPVVVTGDFNITPYSPYFTDWLAVTGLEDARLGRPPAATWPRFLPILGVPIDHCVVSSEFEVLAQRRLPAFSSDHYPIVTQLALRAQTTLP